MSDQYTEEQLNAMEAERILSHPLWVNAFKSLREGYIREIEEGDLLDEARRDKIMLGLQNLKAVRDNLESHIANAEFQMTLQEDY